MAFGRVLHIVFETSLLVLACFRLLKKALKIAPSKSAALILVSVGGLLVCSKEIRLTF